MTTQCVLPGYETSKPEDQILALQKNTTAGIFNRRGENST